jgi:hypothetical protein
MSKMTLIGKDIIKYDIKVSCQLPVPVRYGCIDSPPNGHSISRTSDFEKEGHNCDNWHTCCTLMMREISVELNHKEVERCFRKKTC